MSKTEQTLIKKGNKFNKKQSSLWLSPGVKQIIYSYLTLTELVKTIEKVCKADRKNLIDSAIARENKLFKFTVPNNNCLLHGKEMTNLMEKLNKILPLVEKLDITMKAPNITCETTEHGFHLEFVCLLLELPARFNDRKISIKAVSKSERQFDIDKFMMTMQACRKDMIFKKFTYEGKKTS